MTSTHPPVPAPTTPATAPPGTIVDPVAAVRQALARIEASDRAEIWIHRPESDELIAAAESVARRLADGEHLPLAGLVAAVKDNISVAGWPISAGCPAFSFTPDSSATVVERLRDAGAVIMGTTNMDQFATGLVGTRSPHGAVRNSRFPDYIAGGSSAGSAVAVALGLVDISLGTDTAGSGRVPAAFNGIVGLKPTRGWFSMHGVVPACHSLDCVSVFARDVTLAATVSESLGGFDPLDQWSRQPEPSTAVTSGSSPAPFAGASAPAGGAALRVGVPSASSLATDPDLDQATAAALTASAERFRELGADVVEVDLDVFIQAGVLLYEGAFLAERYDSVGRFIEDHPDDVDPVVASIILSSRELPAHALFDDIDRLAVLARRADATWDAVDVLVMPTTPTVFTIAQIAEQPVTRNSVLGRYTNCCNLLDLAALAIPAGERVDAPPLGITLFGPAWSDARLAQVAGQFLGESVASAAAPESAADAPESPAAPSATTGIKVAVVGAHLSGQPLHSQLSDRSARFVATTTTAPEYRLHALDTVPPKPGLVRVADGSIDGAGSSIGGAAIEVEVWELDAAGFGTFVAGIPSPLCIGKVRLADGSEVSGFLCEPSALGAAPDITSHGGWRNYLASR